MSSFSSAELVIKFKVNDTDYAVVEESVALDSVGTVDDLMNAIQTASREFWVDLGLKLRDSDESPYPEVRDEMPGVS